MEKWFNLCLPLLQHLMVDVDAAKLWYICNCPSTIERIAVVCHPMFPSFSAGSLHNICMNTLNEKRHYFTLPWHLRSVQFIENSTMNLPNQ